MSPGTLFKGLARGGNEDLSQGTLTLYSRDHCVHLGPRQGGKKMHRRAASALTRRLAVLVAEEGGQDCRTVPVNRSCNLRAQAPRSSCSHFCARPSLRGRGGGRVRTSWCNGSTSPVFSSRRMRSANDRLRPEIGESLATGLPRSVMTHSCPRWTSRSNLLNRALASRTPILLGFTTTLLLNVDSKTT